MIKTKLSLNLLLFSILLLGAAQADNPTTLFSSNFSTSQLPPEVSPLHQTLWTVEDGILIGQPATAEQQKKNKAAAPGHFGHNAKMFILSEFEDAVIEFDFRFDEDDCTAVLVNNAPGRSHLFSLSLSTKNTSLMKFHDKKLEGDKKETLAEVPTRLQAQTWHHVKVLMRGAAVTVWVNKKELFTVSHERFGGLKHNPNFRTAGPTAIQLDNIKIKGL